LRAQIAWLENEIVELRAGRPGHRSLLDVLLGR
jgi:hypothetical protein